MAKVTITITDNEKDGAEIVIDPPAAFIAARAKVSQGLDVTPAEMLALYLARSALAFNERVRRESSPIVLANPLVM